MAKVWRWQGLRCFLPGSTKETIWRMEGWLARTGGTLLRWTCHHQGRIEICFFLGDHWKKSVCPFYWQPVWHAHGSFWMILKEHFCCASASAICFGISGGSHHGLRNSVGTHDPYASLQQLLLAANLAGLNRCEQMYVFFFCLVWSETWWNRLTRLFTSY